MAVPSGDQANERWPIPQQGSPCSNGSSTSGRSASRSAPKSVRFSQPERSLRNARSEPTGAKRGCCTAKPSTGSSISVVGSSTGASIHVLTSHDICGGRHECQATNAPSALQHGSNENSASAGVSRMGHAPPASSEATATWRSPTTYATRRPSGLIVGAFAGLAAGCSVSRRGGPPASGCHQRSPSVAAYTSAVPSGTQSNPPPLVARPGHGAGSVVSRRNGPPTTDTRAMWARPPSVTTKATVAASGDSLGSESSRPEASIAAVITRRPYRPAPDVLA